MVYARDSKPRTERFEGSSPSSGTMHKEKVIVILGPTSSGKSALAVALAKKYDGEIVSADSRQVYRGMNLGTGKVTKKEMAGVPHHLLDVASPKERFTVARYVPMAAAAISDIVSRKKIPIVCGGTGFYIDALTSGVVLPDVDPNPKLRKALSSKPAGELFAMLMKLDPNRAQTIEKNNRVRLIRAIEIAKKLGRVPALVKHDAPYHVLKIGLDAPDDILKARISTRLRDRLKAGMLREATKLHAHGLSWRRMRELGLEYRAMADLLTRKITRAEFEKRLALDIWHYAKRQRQWWKRDKTILWLDSSKKSALMTSQKIVRGFLLPAMSSARR